MESMRIECLDGLVSRHLLPQHFLVLTIVYAYLKYLRSAIRRKMMNQFEKTCLNDLIIDEKLRSNTTLGFGKVGIRIENQEIIFIYHKTTKSMQFYKSIKNMADIPVFTLRKSCRWWISLFCWYCLNFSPLILVIAKNVAQGKLQLFKRKVRFSILKSSLKHAMMLNQFRVCVSQLFLTAEISPVLQSL